jgi:signal peptidase
MTVIKTLLNLLSWIFIIGVIILLVFTLGSNTNLLGGYRSYLVQSGSMEPSIMTGDIIIVHASGRYMENDTVTFTGDDGRVVTHRIVDSAEEDGRTFFQTKGDANRSEDEARITQANIIGKVILVVPKIGFFVAFARTLPGLILLIGVPAFALIFDEVIKLFKS